MIIKSLNGLLLLACLTNAGAVQAQAVKMVDAPYVTPNKTGADKQSNSGTLVSPLDDVIGAKSSVKGQDQLSQKQAPAANLVPSGSIVRTWAILPTDGRLATTLERWAKADGMKLVWDAQQHVMLSSSDSYTGTLTEALSRVLTSPAIRFSPYPLEACIYPNSPPVLRITRAGEQSLECP